MLSGLKFIPRDELENSKERSTSKRRREKKIGGSANKKRSGGDRSETQILNDDSRKAMGLEFMLRPEKAAPTSLDVNPLDKKNEHLGDSVYSPNMETRELESKSKAIIDDDSCVKALTANQLAAKVLQFRMKGKHEEAEKLKNEARNIDGTSSRSAMHDFSARQKMKEEDTDLHLAQTIVRNQQFKLSGQADDEYDYDNGPRKKPRSKHNSASEMGHVAQFANRILTQKERCQFCFKNPERPKHLVISIANFTYLSLPRWQPVAPGHCYILTLNHEASTRTVEDSVWDEIRNYKKCLIMMFAEQDKDVIFLETVVGRRDHQRCHCLVECIPVPKGVAKQGPLYFKKAIDEAESEWSQHDAKKLIDTSQKGLRGSIPENFPYFHVEFGLRKGFVHVIDDESQFQSNFGLNVVRGMLRLPEDMHFRRKCESLETQKQSVASFARDWAAFDWTKQLG